MALGLTLTACGGRRADDQPVAVSVIGGPAGTPDPTRAALTPAGRMLLASTAQGLVRFDAIGGIEPGLAERWIVIDDGSSIIFRLREAEWPDGETVTAEQVVPMLRRAVAARANPLAPYLTAIDEIVAMTPQVIEVRLSHPRPDILKLFAQPEMAILAPGGRAGSGPFRIQPDPKPGILLRPGFDPLRDPEAEAEEPSPEQFMRMRGERAAVAIARFAAKRSDLVDGGSFVDWPLLDQVKIAPSDLRIDAATGLFGFAVTHRTGFLADPLNRGAVAMAIDRDAVTAMFRKGWATTETILPDTLDSNAPPSTAPWSAVPANARVATAQARVAQYQQAHGGPITLRIAMPEGPGATLLYSIVGAGLRTIGIEPQRVAIDASADLRLIDAVAPYDSARWYLRSACQPCGSAAATMIEAARDAATLQTRAAHLADADAALAADVAFIPIAQPLRWSLVTPRLRGWTANPRAFHPLNHVRGDPN
jgi:peptide/nickel transport system substrate-binding protein